MWPMVIKSIMFLILSTMQIQCRTALKLQDTNEAANLLNIKGRRSYATLCEDDKDCGERQKCAMEEGSKICVCGDGLAGVDCEVEEWCRDTGRFKDCKGLNGSCGYSVEDRAVVCRCGLGRKLHPTENRCRDPCANSNDCENEGRCENGFCVCKPGLFGDKCESIFDCTKRGKFRGCIDSGGECFFDGSKAMCKCPTYQRYDGSDHACKECDCGPYGSCSFTFGQKQCDCMPFAIEKDGWCFVRESSSTSTTQTSTTSTSTSQDCDCGPYAYSCFLDSTGYSVYTVCRCFSGYSQLGDICAECNCGPYGSCRFEYDRKKCECKSFAIEINGVCVDTRTTSPNTTSTSTEISTTTNSTVQDCHCGYHSYFCTFGSDGKKVCGCFTGYSQLGGLCAECNCGPYGSCSFENRRKKCHCRSFSTEIDGVCVDTPTTSSKYTTSSIIMSTILSSTVQDCDCGENSISCHFDWNDEKICSCSPGYAELHGICQECYCGANARRCFYQKNGTKVCNCDFGYILINGHCSVICNEANCVHGKCEITGNSFNCRCNEGFTGVRCDERVQIKSKKQDLWQILILLVEFAIFALLMGMFCLLIVMMKKRSKI